jgi:MoaA/NifB/PqqE/SkfB family radical SAM enzyme
MRWRNKGHEYDAVYENISHKSAFYLFGAGDYGRQFYDNFNEEINIIGYIDNDVNKQKSSIKGIECNALSDITLKDNEAIILTMSQIARMKPVEQLKLAGFIKDKDYFLIEEFISIYYVYKYNKVYLSTISFLPSTKCNLNCRNCLNFNPFAKEFYIRDMEHIIADIDLFFKCVDYVMIFHVSGGEPMLFKHIAEVIDYLSNNYGDRIGTLRTVTNGTVIPSEEVLSKLSECNVEITVDDYREAIPNSAKKFDRLLEKLTEHKIKHYVNYTDSWVDLAPERTDFSNLSDEQLQQHRDECNQSWQELRDGKLYSCNYAAYATVAGIAGEQDLEETYNLRDFDDSKKKELVEFRLGYTTKGYTNFCKHCRGFTESSQAKSVKPAIQVKRGEI